MKCCVVVLFKTPSHNKYARPVPKFGSSVSAIFDLALHQKIMVWLRPTHHKFLVDLNHHITEFWSGFDLHITEFWSSLDLHIKSPGPAWTSMTVSNQEKLENGDKAIIVYVNIFKNMILMPIPMFFPLKLL